MRSGRHFLRALVAAVVAAALACGGEPPRPGGASPPVGLGGPETLRLAVLSPSAAETLAALGRLDQVVAVGDFVAAPAELRDRPRLGGYDAPNPERLLALGVDLLVTTAGVAGREARARLGAHGIEVLELETASYEGALASMVVLGARVGRAEAAAELAARADARVREIERATHDLPRRTVLVVVGREPLFVAGPGSYLDRLLAAAGGENVAADLGSPFVQASLEAMLERRPEVIVDSSDNTADGDDLIRFWSRYPFLPAVAAGRVWAVAPAELAIPGPRLGEIAALLARCIHPERFEPAAAGARE